MLEVQAHSGQKCFDGQSDEQPLRLDGISKESFELFLSVVIPK
jgi:hypothetical protein